MKLSPATQKKHVAAIHESLSERFFSDPTEIWRLLMFFFIHKKSWKHNLNVPSTCQKESSNPWGFYPNHHTGNKLSPCLKGKEKTHDIFLESPNQNIWQVSRLTCSMCFSNCFKEHSLRCSKSILLFPGFEFGVLKLRDLPITTHSKNMGLRQLVSIFHQNFLAWNIFPPKKIIEMKRN